MRATRLGAVSLFMAVFGSVAMTSLASELPSNTGLAAINKQDKMIRIYWPYLGQFIDEYPGYKAVSYCEGSFSHERYAEAALLLVNPDKREGLYIAVIGMGAKTAEIVELGRIKTAFDDSSWIANISCHSYTELLRLDTSMHMKGSTVEGSIHPISVLDGICVWYGDENNNDASTNVCYGFSRKTGKFVEIGSWLT